QTQSAIGVDAGELRMLGVIGGNAGINKVGAGKLTLVSANTYTGTTNVNAGVLSIEHSGALAAGTTTNVSAGAAVEVRGGVSPIGALNISGTGILNTGALRNPAGTDNWAGPITLA